MRGYRSINQDDLLHDLYEQFCLRENQSLRESKIFHLALGLTKIICYYVGKEEKPKECSKNQNFLLTSLHIKIYANNVLIILAKQKKLNYIRGKIENSSRHQKTLFNTVKLLSGVEPIKKYPDGFANDNELANKFAEFFITKIEKIHKSFVNDTHSTPTLTPMHSCAVLDSSAGSKYDNLVYKYEFEPTTPEEIKAIVCENGVKCSFPDPCPDFVLKNHLTIFIPLLSKLVNLSLKTGSMAGLKHAFVSPLLKNINFDTNQFKNFRPVSNLQFLSKLIERVVSKRLNMHFDNNDLSISQQYEYKKGHSCETLLVKLINDRPILLGFDNKFASVLLLLDLSAAFDTVNISILLNILQSQIDIRGILLMIIDGQVNAKR